ncbi:MAG: ATP-binding protein [Verrucomicrobiales bacterium]|nr:ATP-binding protein [Verrucomicrobiales bacterium]
MSAPDEQPFGESNRTLLDTKAFSVSARVALQLGRESISSSVTAILELVKNAYDADATLARIRFQGLNSAQPKLVIEDNGRGMSVDDLRNHWMVIGTANKTKTRKTSMGRVQTGEKELGRLGLDRLCERTRVQSITAKSGEGIELDVDWRRYEQAESRLEEVRHEIYGVPNLDRDPLTQAWVKFPQGTRLILEQLKDDWSLESLAELRAELSLLVSPFSAPNDFRIELDTGLPNESLDGPVSVPPFVLEAASWKVVATIDDHDMVEIRMNNAGHDVEYHQKPVPWGEWQKGSGTKSFCGPMRFEFYFFPRKEATVGGQTLSKTKVSQFLDANQGIRIYRDGFRVKPYGQPNGDGDWLQLAFKKTRSPEGVAQDAAPGAWRLGYHQVVGAVFLTLEKNPALSDQTNREGLLEGKAFAHLRVFAAKVVRFFELKHQEFEIARKRTKNVEPDAEEKAKESAVASADAMNQLSALLAKLRQQPGSSGTASQAEELVNLLASTQQSLEKAKSSAEESAQAAAVEKAQVERQKNMLSNLASLGILAAAFGHETVDWAGNVVKYAERLDDDVISKAWWLAEAERPDVQKTMKFLVSESRKLRKFAKFTLGNISREKRSKKKDVCLRRVMDTVFSAFREVLEDEKKIRPEYPQAGDFCIEGYAMDWESIFVNLIINASWAMETTPPDERKIRVEIRTENGFHIVQFDDTGRGLEAGTEDAIFEPTFTTKRNERGEEIGTGLGLTIVKAFVEEHSQGKVTAKQKGALGGASFTIIVPASARSAKRPTP